ARGTRTAVTVHEDGADLVVSTRIDALLAGPPPQRRIRDERNRLTGLRWLEAAPKWGPAGVVHDHAWRSSGVVALQQRGDDVAMDGADAVAQRGRRHPGTVRQHSPDSSRESDMDVDPPDARRRSWWGAPGRLRERGRRVRMPGGS